MSSDMFANVDQALGDQDLNVDLVSYLQANAKKSMTRVCSCPWVDCGG